MGAEVDLPALELMKAHAVNTLTVCYRNVLREFPPEILTGQIGDLFIWSLLGAHGKGKYLESIEASIYRVHSGGIFSEKNNKAKLEMWRCKSNGLFLYYSRMKNPLLSKYFQEVTILTAIKSYGVKAFLVLFVQKTFKSINPFKKMFGPKTH